MSVLAQRGITQGRPMALAVTIGVHVALVAGLLAIKVVDVVKDYTAPLQLVRIDEKPKPVQFAEPIDPKLQNLDHVAQPVPQIPDFDVDESPIEVLPTLMVAQILFGLPEHFIHGLELVAQLGKARRGWNRG